MNSPRIRCAAALWLLPASLLATPPPDQEMTLTATQQELVGEAVVGTGFTYQGFLTQGGTPVNGTWDFEFLLFDDPAAGSQVGSTVAVGDLAVAAGVFTSTVDFGAAAFGGGGRWLEIHVRPGASAGAFTSLVPRQKIAPTPTALSVPNLYTDETTGFVGVGRSFRISGSEVFGVRAISGAGQYGGMYVETSDADGWPFYGFATDGVLRAWTSYKRDACSTPSCSLSDLQGWKLNLAGVRLAVPESGGLRIGPAADHSLVIENTTGLDGIRVLDTGDDGIQIGSNPDIPNYGVYIPSPGVSTYGLWSNTSNASGEWALYSVDNVQAGNFFAFGTTQIARVGGERPLAVGELAAAAGFGLSVPGAQDYIPTVVAAASPDRLGVIGVVRGRMEWVARPGKEGEDAYALESRPGEAAPGDFVALTVRGVAAVRVEPDAEVEIGERLTVAEGAGTARALHTRLLEGMEITEGAPVVGVVVGAIDDRTGSVPAYVMLP